MNGMVARQHRKHERCAMAYIEFDLPFFDHNLPVVSLALQ
jgi:hypothetical protein